MYSSEPPSAIATLITHDDISLASKLTTGEESPLLKLTAEARSKGYQSICIPLTTEKWKARWTDTCLLPLDYDPSAAAGVNADHRAELWRSNPAFEIEEVTMTKLDEADGVTVLVSEWLELDAEDDWVRDDYEIALQQEVAYASYLNIQTIILPPPRNRNQVASYARTINDCLRKHPYLHFSVRLPLYDPPEFQPKINPKRNSTRVASMPSASWLHVPPRLITPGAQSKSSMLGELNGTWEMWDLIRTICEYDARLTLTLDLSLPLPSDLGILKKWQAESVRHIFLPASSFIANAKGYPVLPKGTQAFVRDSMTHHPTVVLLGTNSSLHACGGEAAYSQYVRYLESTSSVVQAAQREGTVENFAQGYQDYLQAPLQPLMDNLPSTTYHTFEQDPIKYGNYEEAIYRALMDMPSADKLVICVAGAGRGPLVSRSLQAMDKARRSGIVYAIEKNPNACVTLQGRKQAEWGAKVNLLFGDMRYVDVPEKADILVSELLGSFGDNELSPECLDGAVRFLKPNGVSIPSSYTAHLAPLSSSKLYHDARYGKDEKSPETPYVVMFNAVNILSGTGIGSEHCGPQIQECWEFEHPPKDPVVDAHGLPFTNTHNSRTAKLRYHIPHTGILHGLAGYFEAVLYGNIGLSIHPRRKDKISKDMLSWFPLFFPFKDPLYLPGNSELHVSIWRRTDQRRVWYEWYAESFLSVKSDHPFSEVRERETSGSLFTKFLPPIGGGSSPLSMDTVGVPPSPLVDAIDSPSADGRPRAETGNILDKSTLGHGLVKIGQTALHNPGGRSSWIRL